MTEEFQSRGAEEGGGVWLESPGSSRGRPRFGAGVVLLVLVLLGVQTACATGYPMGGTLAGAARHRRMAPPEAEAPRDNERPDREMAATREDTASGGQVSTGVGAEGMDGPGVTKELAVEGLRPRARTRHGARADGAVDEEEDWGGVGVGWPDGVGDAHSYKVPFSVDYFQGFLVRAGVPSTSLPGDGRTVSPPQALELLPHLLSTPVTLGNFGLRRMAAHLLLEVATGGQVVTREELHARMRRFSRLLVLRPDGYLVKPGTGEAVQRAGEVVLAEDGTLRAGRFEVGPFYAIDGGRLFPVDQELAVPHGARPAGLYAPDDNAGLALAEGVVVGWWTWWRASTGSSSTRGRRWRG
ncbi:hypothetical protein F0U59_16765 [Archangium gephyra]|nr:hypothetical protein F0U59_16765 [Archangium gephyra]